MYYLNDQNLYFFEQNVIYYIFIMKQNDVRKNDIFIYNQLIEEINAKNAKIKINKIVKNKDNELFCKNNEEIVILFEKQSYDIFSDIVKYINDYEYLNTIKLPSLNMKEIMENEIDEIETLVLDNYDNNHLVKKSFNFFVGMAENAVQLLNEYDTKDEKYLGVSENFFEFEIHNGINVFNLFRTNKYYNVAFEIKRKVYLHRLNYDDMDKILYNISDNDLIYLFSIFLYPIEFFEIIKLLFNCDSDFLKERYNKVAKRLIDNVGNYVKFLNYVKNKCIKHKKIELINWIM